MWSTIYACLKSLVFAPPARAGEEKRERLRVRCHIPVWVEQNGTVTQGTLIDVSRSGAQVLTEPTLKGQDVELRLQALTVPQSEPLVEEAPGMRPLRCSIVWSRAHSFRTQSSLGLRFREGALTGSWVEQLFDQLTGGTGERRTFIRLAAPLEASLRLGERVVAGRLHDLSLGGLQVETDEDLPTGPVQLELGRYGPLRGLTCQAVVVGARTAETGAARLYNLSFLELNQEQESQLGKYVVRLLQESGGD